MRLVYTPVLSKRQCVSSCSQTSLSGVAMSMEGKEETWGLPHGSLFLVALCLFTWICAMVYDCHSPESVRSQLSLNLIAEAAGMLVTWFVVDTIVRHRSTQEAERLLLSRKILLSRMIRTAVAVVGREILSLSEPLESFHAPMLRAIADRVEALNHTCEFVSLNIQDASTVDSVATLMDASNSLIDVSRQAAAALSRRDTIAASDTQNLLATANSWKRLAKSTQTQIEQGV